MRQNKKSSLRGSVTQNNISVRMRADDEIRFGFWARLGLLAAIFVLFAAIVGFAWHAGAVQREAASVRDMIVGLTQKAGFAVADIEVEGRARTAKADLFDALRTDSGAPIFDVDSAGAAARLAKLPWVAQADVERRLPDTVFVALTERQPSARWQNDGHVTVIDAQGHVLPGVQAGDFPTLPLVVGDGAAAEAQKLIDALKAYPAIQSQVDAAIRVSDRRWNLHLLSGTTVELPEGDVGTALQRLMVQMDRTQILNRAATVIDLRIPDRIIVEPAAPAASGHKR
ncbi:MAG: cell division protein FtsQ/DivIB [Alphaproteobacteria bacterium]|nr:cell division protein FtsQ/DivIB [Alphaproteobacteria bacterium]